MTRLAPLLLFLVAALQTGCLSSKLAEAFVAAPNGGDAAAAADLPLPPLYQAVHTLDVPGPPPIRLAYWIKEPVGHDQPRATVLLIHGWASKVRSSDLLQPVTTALARAGCRVVLPDLRGHGDSTGDFVTSGRLEVADLQALLGRLEAQGKLAGPLGIAGHSYGGGVALQFAARDSRAAGVLALSPLADIRPAMLPGVHFVLRQKYAVLYPLFFRWAITQDTIDDAQARMRQRTGTDLARHNALAQIPRVTAPVLILQGGQDIATPPAGAEKLRAANPGRVRVHLYPKADHVSYFKDDRDDLRQRVTAWAASLQAQATED